MRINFTIIVILVEIILTDQFESNASTAESTHTKTTPNDKNLHTKLLRSEANFHTESSTLKISSKASSTKKLAADQFSSVNEMTDNNVYEITSTDTLFTEKYATDVTLLDNTTTEIILADQTTQFSLLPPPEVTFNCKFNYDFDWLIIGRIYMCTVLNNLTITSENTTVKAVTGEHRIFKSNDKIFALWFLDKEMNFLPIGITNFFRHIAGMVINRSKLKQLRQNDIAPLYKIRELYLIENDLEVLEGNLFEYNKRLELLWLDGNKIKRIDANIFDGLERLQYLNFREKSCMLKKIKYDPQGIKKVLKEMKRKCVKN